MIRRRKPLLDPATLPEDLGVDWSRWSDGRAYRLKKKKHFPNVEPGHARRACEAAARRMGKVARTTRDKMMPDKLIWVQFADFEIPEGQPCLRCGSRRIWRLHADFARCPSCHAQMILAQKGLDDVDEDGPAPKQKFAARLRALSNVHLERTGDTGESELYNGYAEQDDGTRVVVLAEFTLDDDEELTTENMFERITHAKVLPAHLFEGMVDVEALVARPASDWDLVL
ncbi:MAG TPA: hypothetical protein VFA24_08245 [Gaiellaceae bacterium]|nr:hypothetical protein [Gaiellaceae bacterium]